MDVVSVKPDMFKRSRLVLAGWISLCGLIIGAVYVLLPDKAYTYSLMGIAGAQVLLMPAWLAKCGCDTVKARLQINGLMALTILPAIWALALQNSGMAFSAIVYLGFAAICGFIWSLVYACQPTLFSVGTGVLVFFPVVLSSFTGISLLAAVSPIGFMGIHPSVVGISHIACLAGSHGLLLVTHYILKRCCSSAEECPHE